MGDHHPHPLKVFVSYRTHDTVDFAATLARSLKETLGVDAVYYAPTDNAPYDDWYDRIEGHLDASNIVVALIGPNWANCPPSEPNGTCIHDARDWVRREVVHGRRDPDTALLPVLVRGGSVELGLAATSECSCPTRVDDDDLTVLTDIARVHGVSVRDEAEESDDHQRVLAACWLGLHRIDDQTMVVVADGSDEARVQLDELVAKLLAEDLVDATTLSRTLNDPFGVHAISLRATKKRWPKVVVLAPRKPSEKVLARGRAFAELRGVKEVGLLGAGAIAQHVGAFEAAGSSVKAVVWDSPNKLAGSLKAGWWKSLTAGTKVAVAGASTATVAAAGIGVSGLLLSDASVGLWGGVTVVGTANGHVVLSDDQGAVAVPFDADADAWRFSSRDDYGRQSLSVDESGEVIAYYYHQQLVTPGNERDDVIEVVSLSDRTSERAAVSNLDVPASAFANVVSGDRIIVADHGSEIWIGDLSGGTERSLRIESPPFEIVAPGFEAEITNVRPVQVFPDERRLLAVATYDIFDPVQREAQREQLEAGEVVAVDLSIHDQFLVVDMDTGEVLVWGPLDDTLGFAHAYLSPDASQIALLRDQRIAVYDAATGDPIVDEDTDLDGASYLLNERGNPWSPDGNRLVFEASTSDADLTCVFAILTAEVQCFDVPVAALEQPVWDLDSDQIIAFTERDLDDANTSGIWIIDPDTGQTRQLRRLDRAG